MPFSIKTLRIIIKKCRIQYNILLSAAIKLISLIVVMLRNTLHSVMLNVIYLVLVMLNVVAPKTLDGTNKNFLTTVN